MECLSPQGVLLPLVYGATASPLWLELRGLSAWQATPSRTVYRLTCQRLLPWLRVTFAMVPDAAWPGSDQRPWGTAPAAGLVGRLSRPSAPDPWGVGSFLSLCRPTCARVCGVLGHLAPVHRPLGALLCLCGVLGRLPPVHRCARSVCCLACAVSWATWLLFTGVPARCVALLVRCPWPLGSCSPECPLGALLCVCGVLGHLAPVHRCARWACCVACAVSWATWLLFTGVPAVSAVWRVRCPGPPGLCLPVCPLGALLCVCAVLGHLAPVHQCARLVRCFACVVSWATWLLFTGVPTWCVACVCGVLGHLAPVHRCARLVRCFACAVSWATWLLFTGVSARRVVLLVRCPGPLGSCSPVCPLGVLPVCAVSWATWLLFTGVPAWCVVLLVRCPGPLGSCSLVCPLGVLCCVCGVLGHLAPGHRCALSACGVACAVSWATRPLFTVVPAVCAVWRVRRPGPPGPFSPVCPLGPLLYVCGALGHLAPVHWCARSVCCLCVRCPGPLDSCSPVCPPGVLFCLCGVLGHLAPVHWCARSVRCFACAVS